MASVSVDLDHRGFLYFSFVVCCGRVAVEGIFLFAIVSERLNKHDAGNLNPGRGNADSKSTDAQAA